MARESEHRPRRKNLKVTARPAVEPVALVIFAGPPRQRTPAEKMVDEARRAVALDNLERFARISPQSRRLVCTPDPVLSEQAELLGAEVVPTPAGDEFSWGETFQDLVVSRGLSRVFYLGAGSAALMSEREWRHILRGLDRGERLFYTNNLFSSDFVAYTASEPLKNLQMIGADNRLAFFLQEMAGLRPLVMPASAGTLFDLDTPAELAILERHPSTGPGTRRVLAGMDLPRERLEGMVRALEDPDSEVFLYGRVGSVVWGHLETHTRCRWRVFSEERGMRARGRVERGEVKSLLVSLLKDMGSWRLFEHLAEVVHAAIFDTRVLVASLFREDPITQADRFASDLLAYQRVRDPWLRIFTNAAAHAPFPVLLGGHNLVSGGLWALADLVDAGLLEDIEPGNELIEIEGLPGPAEVDGQEEEDVEPGG